MSSGDPVSVSAQRLLTLRILLLLQVLCSVIAGVMAIQIGQRVQARFTPDSPLLSFIGIGFAITVGLAYLVVPKLILRGWLRKVARDEEPFARSVGAAWDGTDATYWAIFYKQSAIGGALLQGTIFIQFSAYMIEVQPWTLGIALFFWLLLLLKFPTESGVRRWIETQRDRVELLRNSGM